VIFIDRLKGDAMRKFMRKLALLSTSLVVMLVALLAAEPAQALDNVTFVKSTGSGTACTLTAPCAGFQNAQTATAAGGEIHCLDSGVITGTVIIKSLTIDCGGFATTTTFFTINSAGIVVTIRNLTISGVSGFTAGIDFLEGAALLVENCFIENYNASVTDAGIRFRPSAPSSKLVVTDTVVRNNGSGSTGGGIVINPGPGGSAQIVLNRVTVDKNIFGIVADGTGSTGGINMTITDSVASGNVLDGIVATTPSGGAPIGVLVTGTKSANNAVGIRSIGSNVTVRTESSKIAGNGAGLAFSGGGALLTAGNNMVRANGSDGAFSGPVALQ
jgi:hypothetical protein